MAGHDPDTRQSSPDAWEAPLLLTNPTDDRTFRDDALASIRSGQEPDGLARKLRPQYPAVTVHERLVSDEPFRVWYVYREGRWVGRGSGPAEVPQGDPPAAPERHAAKDDEAPITRPAEGSD